LLLRCPQLGIRFELQVQVFIISTRVYQSCVPHQGQPQQGPLRLSQVSSIHLSSLSGYSYWLMGRLDHRPLTFPHSKHHSNPTGTSSQASSTCNRKCSSAYRRPARCSQPPHIQDRQRTKVSLVRASRPHADPPPPSPVAGPSIDRQNPNPNEREPSNVGPLPLPTIDLPHRPIPGRPNIHSPPSAENYARTMELIGPHDRYLPDNCHQNVFVRESKALLKHDAFVHYLATYTTEMALSRPIGREPVEVVRERNASLEERLELGRRRVAEAEAAAATRGVSQTGGLQSRKKKIITLMDLYPERKAKAEKPPSMVLKATIINHQRLHECRWDALPSMTGPIAFNKFPWPLPANHPRSSPADITYEAVETFMTTKNPTPSDSADELDMKTRYLRELARWQSVKTPILDKVSDKDRPLVAEASQRVVQYISTLLQNL